MKRYDSNRIDVRYKLCVRTVAAVALFFTIGILPFSVAKAADSKFDAMVAQFNSSGGSAACANRIFFFLDKERFTDSRITFSSSVPTDSLRQQVWYWAAEWYNDGQDYAKAKDYALKALPLYKYSGSEKADCLNLLGIIHLRLGDFSSAATYAKQSVDIDMRGGDADRISSGLNTLAGIYMAADQMKDAERYILNGLKYAERAHNPSRKAILMGMASEVYHKLGHDLKALDYARSAFELDSAQGKTPKMAIRLSQMASALAGLKRLTEAESTYRRAIALLREVGNMHSVGIDLNQLGFLLVEQKRHREAVACFLEASKIFAQMGDLYNRVHACKGLYESYWDINPDSAKIALRQFNELKDSLYQQASAEALARYSAEFDNGRLQEEIAQRKQARVRDLALGVGLFVVIVVVTVFCLHLYFRKQRVQMRRLVKEVEELKDKFIQSDRSDARPATVRLKSAVPVVAPDENSFMEQLFAVVDEASAKGECSVAQIASAMNMSERTFCRRLKEQTCQSPKMFISAIQMERCAKLLVENPSKTISEVAHMCGFGEASGFSHAFKRVYGCSPSAYRDRQK